MIQRERERRGRSGECVRMRARDEAEGDERSELAGIENNNTVGKKQEREPSALNIFFRLFLSPFHRPASGRPPPFVMYDRPKTSSQYRVVPTLRQENRGKLAYASESSGILVNTVISPQSVIRGLYGRAQKCLLSVKGREMYVILFSFFSADFSSVRILHQSVFRSTDSRSRR